MKKGETQRTRKYLLNVWEKEKKIDREKPKDKIKRNMCECVRERHREREREKKKMRNTKSARNDETIASFFVMLINYAFEWINGKWEATENCNFGNLLET